MNMQRFRLHLQVIVFAVGMPTAAITQPVFPRADLSLGMYRIDAEIAATPETREHGLMFRGALPKHHGMIFVFPVEGRHCMWMRNTLLPLEVAFLDNRGAVINIEEMRPRTENNHCASRNARFALEMNAGWFRDRGIGAGAVVSGIDRLPQPF